MSLSSRLSFLQEITCNITLIIDHFNNTMFYNNENKRCNRKWSEKKHTGIFFGIEITREYKSVSIYYM